MNAKVVKRMRLIAKLTSGDKWERRYKAFKRNPSIFHGTGVADQIKDYRQGARADALRRGEITRVINASRRGGSS